MEYFRRALLRGLIMLLVLPLLLMAGCAGPKRLPPVEYSSESGGYATARPPIPELLTVGLLENENLLTVGSTGAALVLGQDADQVLIRLEDGPATLTCRRAGDRVAWQAGGDEGESSSIRLQPIDPDHRVTQEKSEYRGEFLIIPTPGRSGLTLINTLDLEAYLRGVVPWEIGRHGQDKLAALEAQAVAARTYTVSHLGARMAKGFDVFASVMDQVYRGSKDEDPLCNQAVESTAGMVLENAGQPIDAYYSACCGGVSSLIQEVWPYAAQPYLKSRPDAPETGATPFCAEYKYFNWRETWSVGQLEDILQATLPEYLTYMSSGDRPGWAGPTFMPKNSNSDPQRPGALIDLEILDYTTSGRVAKLAVTTEAGIYHVRGDRTRWVLKPAGGNPAILRSAMFEVELILRNGQLAEVAARGRGYGHGLGLCQTGALAMAENGYTYEEILGHYYSGAALTRTGGD